MSNARHLPAYKRVNKRIRFISSPKGFRLIVLIVVGYSGDSGAEQRLPVLGANVNICGPSPNKYSPVPDQYGRRSSEPSTSGGF